jgi:hypothetical protein
MLTLIIMPIIFGIMLPLIEIPILGHSENIFWGCVYGLGFYITNFVFHFKNIYNIIFGILCWWIIIELILYAVWVRMCRTNAIHIRSIIICLFLISFLIIVPIDIGSGALFANFPLLFNMLSVIY